MNRHLLPSLLMLGGALSAQTPLSGDVFDGGGGGPLLSGVVYHATANLRVPLGQSLTVQPGAIVKFQGSILTVDGTILCQGTAGSPVVLTSLPDDSAGGDTNGDGPSSGSVNQWFGVRCTSAASASVFRHTSIRFTGVGSSPSLRLTSCDPLIDSCELRDGGRGGLVVDGAARPTVTGCSFVRIAGTPAASGFALDAVQNLANNTATDCSGGNYLRVDSASTFSTLNLQASNLIGGVMALNSNLVVNAGAALTLGPGVIVKAVRGLTISVDGVLVTEGSSAQPVVFTSFADDSAGGDTNGDGPSSGARNQWFGLRLQDGADASSLRHTEIRHGGLGGWEGLALLSADAAVADCEVRDCGSGGIRLDGVARPSVTRCHVTGVTGGPAIFGVSILALPGFSANTVSNNAAGNYLRVDSAVVNADLALVPDNVPGGVLPFLGNLDVNAGVTLNVGAGLVLKPIQAATISINGTISCVGQESAEIVFTSFRDDSYGGDTNGDGNATMAGPDDWFGVRCNPGAGASVFEHVVFRGSGVGGWAAIDVRDDVRLRDCWIRDAGSGGLFTLPAARPSVEGCLFENVEGEVAVRGVSWESVGGFVDNEAVNCPGGAYIRVTGTVVTQAAVLTERNQINGVFVFPGNISVESGAQMDIRSGVTLKSTAATTFIVNGDLRVRGLVVLTHITDDSFGGDTNGDGNLTTPATNSLFGLRFNVGSTGFIDRMLVRFGGAGGWQGIDCRSTQVALRRSRAEFCGTGGFRIDAASVAEELVAYGNVGNGFLLGADPIELLQCTSAFNSGDGYVATVAPGSGVNSSIAHANSGTGYVGFSAGSIRFSFGSGIVGGTGNRTGDPRFVSPATGDLRLQANSPALDAGGPGFMSVGTDFFNDPRVQDGNLDGVPRVDMGAYEYAHVRLTVTGAPEPGGTLSLNLTSTPSIAAGGLAIGLALPVPAPLLNFGPIYVDLNGPAVAFLIAPNSTTPLSIPSTLPGPLTMTFQGLGLGLPFPRGNMSNPVSVLIE